MTVNGGARSRHAVSSTPRGNPINAYDRSGTLIDARRLPATSRWPDPGRRYGATDARVTYTKIDNIPGFAGQVVSAGGPYTITEGQNVTLTGTATAPPTRRSRARHGTSTAAAHFQPQPPALNSHAHLGPTGRPGLERPRHVPDRLAGLQQHQHGDRLHDAHDQAVAAANVSRSRAPTATAGVSLTRSLSPAGSRGRELRHHRLDGQLGRRHEQHVAQRCHVGHAHLHERACEAESA